MNSSSDNNADSTLPMEIEPLKRISSQREELKALFADNKTPSGNDFARLISAVAVPSDDGLMIDAASSVLNIKFAASANNGLTVAGQPLDVKEGLSVAKAASLEGELVVAKDSTLKGKAVLEDGLEVRKSSQFKADATVESQLTVKGETRLGGLEVNKAAHVKETLTVDGQVKSSEAEFSTLTVTEQANLNRLTVGQSAEFKDTLEVANHVTLHGSLSLPDLLEVNGDQIVAKRPLQLGNTLTVGSTATVKGSLTVDSNASIQGSLAVEGGACLNGGLQVDNLLVVDKTAVSARAQLVAEKGLQVKGLSQLQGGVRIEHGVKQNPVEIRGEDGESVELVVTDSARLGVNTDKPAAQLHVVSPPRTVLLQLDRQTETGLQSALKVNEKGEVSIGNVTARSELEVNGDTYITGNLVVDGQPGSYGGAPASGGITANCLTIEGHLIADAGEVVVEAPLKAQKQLTACNGAEVSGGVLIESTSSMIMPLRVKDSQNHTMMVLTPEGQLGLGLDQPQAALHVATPLGVDALLVERCLDGVHKTTVRIDGEGKITLGSVPAPTELTLHGTMQVDGDLDVKGVHVKERLTVEGEASFKDKLELAGELSAGSLRVADAFRAEPHAVNLRVPLISEHFLIAERGLRLGTKTDEPIRVESKAGAVLTLSQKGRLALNGATPDAQLSIRTETGIDSLQINRTLADGSEATSLLVNRDGNLEVMGGMRLAGPAVMHDQVQIAKDLEVLGETQLKNSLTALGGLQLASGEWVNEISSCPWLGRGDASDEVLATQRATKHYIDHIYSPWGRNSHTLTIRNQAEFEQVFGDGCQNRVTLPANATILLMPPENGPQHGAHTGRDGLSRPCRPDVSHKADYLLRNAVQIPSGVSIIGMNTETTRVVKANAHCRLLLGAEDGKRVRNVRLSGWTFDGGNTVFSGNGGAIQLLNAEDITLDLVLIGHIVHGKGGALFGENSRRITATQIHACQARGAGCHEEGLGGAAYGLSESRITATFCYADHGGAVAYCHDSEVVANRCEAEIGGGAYASRRLKLSARQCVAYRHGGGASLCDSLMAEGYWRDNRSDDIETHNIVANVSHSHRSHHAHAHHYLWRGDYIDGPLLQAQAHWRHDNI
ncbi:polymer-forming cytoskeletal protein [Parachitinimonas caeni]|uniref:Polymer-forming cytoskeletal protein n=1 Tax=Parachitinimonas caeni TaxID=3031301 RepID=A0ABT7E290_9NEIS|nr:polymer-forming cytoskeletal protein [Parachitinimonas caeni]MDK2125453.1 polymer-forming cytoskeletal protein [Parachitinimonas caeni]